MQEDSKKSMTPLETVEFLNERIHGEHGEHEQNFNHAFSYSTTGTIESITLDINLENSNIIFQLWNSECDNRKWIEENNDYEPLNEHIVCEFNEILKTLKKLQKFFL